MKDHPLILKEIIYKVAAMRPAIQKRAVNENNKQN